MAAVLKRDRAIVAMGLAGIATLAWIYLIYMDWGMRHMDVGMNMVIMPAMQHWTAWDLALVFLMWVVMMVAMMIPAASPVILLFYGDQSASQGASSHLSLDRTIPAGLPDRVDGL